METCSNCNYVFPEAGSAEIASREPCPQCGSIARTIKPSVKRTINITITRAKNVTTNSLPPFSFGAIVIFERVVPDGQIITFIDPMYTHLINVIQKDPNYIYQIDPRKWEEVIAAAYDKAGFDEVILTPRSGDLGRDVIAIKKGFGSVKFIEQVKAYNPGHVVKADEVRSLLGVLHAEQDASKAIFSTTSIFAPKIEEDKLIKPFLPTRLELINKEKLLNRLVDLNKQK